MNTEHSHPTIHPATVDNQQKRQPSGWRFCFQATCCASQRCAKVARTTITCATRGSGT